MRRAAAIIACGLICLLVGSALMLAQEGHPLTGVWHGDYGTSASPRTQVVFSMRWDTKNVVGKVNPGANAIPLKVATLDASKWMVHFECDVKDSSGKPVHIAAEGKIEDLGSYHRKISGSWRQGAVTGDFRITRD